MSDDRRASAGPASASALAKPMPPTEILRDAEDMVQHYPGDRLRLTGAELIGLVDHVWALALAEAAKVPEASLVRWRKGGSPTFQEESATIRALVRKPVLP